jgi:starvation-inducible DNA-binding protein
MSRITNNETIIGATSDAHRPAHEMQAYGSVIHVPIALGATVRRESAGNLNQLLADTITLRDLYKKHHWQVSGPTFYSLHLLFDKHAAEQSELIDEVAERVMTLGGVAVAVAHDVAEMTFIPRSPKGRETAPVQLTRLLHAHEIVLEEARAMARLVADLGDHGTNDLLVSAVIRTNETQAWFLSEHLVDAAATAGEDAREGIGIALRKML